LSQNNRKIDNIHAKPKRRSFSTEYKLRILEEIDRADQFGQITFILRREGLFSSHLTDWRRWREKLSASGDATRSKATSSSLKRENQHLQHQNRRLKEKLDQANLIIQLQKKLNLSMAEMDNLNNHENAP